MAQFTFTPMTMTPLAPEPLADRRERGPLRAAVAGIGSLRLGRAVAAVVIAAWCLFLLLWGALYGIILPRVASWKPEVESFATQALGLTVKIGDMAAPATGWVPALHLQDVELQDAQGRLVLRLPRVSAALSPQSLLALEPRFEQLLVIGAALEVRRDAAGRIHVAGLDLDTEGRDPQQPAASARFDAAEWLLRQGEFAIRGAKLRWVDEQRQAPPVELSDVDFVLRNSLRRHAFRIDATPPAALGERWTLRGRFRQGLFEARTDWRTWSGEVYAHVPSADVDGWQPFVDIPPELRSGLGAARVWLDVDRGRLRGATADVALRDVRLRWPGVSQDLAFDRVDGRIVARQELQALTLGLERLGFTTAQGLEWPASDMKLVLRHHPVALLTSDNDIIGGEFSAARLDLGLMASVASRLPLGSTVQDWVRQLAPRGRVEALQARWEGALAHPRRYHLSGTLAQLELEPGVPQTLALSGATAPGTAPGSRLHPGRPGVAGATVTIDATEEGGRADWSMDGGRIVLPGVFEDPVLPIEASKARLAWQWKPPGANGRELSVQLVGASAKTPELQGKVQATWRTVWGAAGPEAGSLDLNATVSEARAESLARYLPLTVPADARSYVRKAVTAGRLQDVAFRFRGPLTAPAEFRITGRWRDGQLHYVPGDGEVTGWPEATRVDTRLRYEGQRLEFSELRGRLLGTELARASGRIDFAAPTVPLTLDVQTRGPAYDLIRYVQATPLHAATDRVLAEASASGSAQATVRLELPLAGPSEALRVRGAVQLAGNDLRWGPGVPVLTSAKGRLEFTERSFSLASVTGQVLGGDVSVEGGRTPAGALRVALQGQVSASALRAAPEFQALLPITQRLSGQAPYRLQFAAGPEPLQWTLSSSMAGMGIDLPPPFDKRAEGSWAAVPLRIQVQTVAGNHEQWDVFVGNRAQARAVRERVGEEARWLRAAVAVGAAEIPVLPASGLEVFAEVGTLSLDGWKAVADTLLPPARTAGLSGGRAPRSAGQASARAEEDFFRRPVVRLQAGAVQMAGRSLQQVKARIRAVEAPGESGWQADIESRELTGRIDWWPGSADGRQSRLRARLSRLTVDAGGLEGSDAPAPAASAQTPGTAEPTWPALDITAAAFELRGRKLGSLAIEAQVRDGGRAWELRRFSLDHPDAALMASGLWRLPSATQAHRTQLDFQLQLRDAGALFSHLGYADALRGGRGQIRGAVEWTGTPLSPTIRTMAGRIRLDGREGQFLKADPGAARLLGVLSLQSLPRRLVLDFRDVFQEGFPFDSLEGDVTVASGVASTRNLRMRGLQAAVLMEGTADLLHETQNLHVLVIPEINAGTASLAYAAVNPVLGLGTFLAQLFLRRPLMAANTREFNITGTWTDPKVERLERAAGPTAEQVERAVAAPSPLPAPLPASAPTSPSSSPQ